jgi:hypothetical protein
MLATSLCVLAIQTQISRNVNITTLTSAAAAVLTSFLEMRLTDVNSGKLVTNHLSYGTAVCRSNIRNLINVQYTHVSKCNTEWNNKTKIIKYPNKITEILLTTKLPAQQINFKKQVKNTQ